MRQALSLAALFASAVLLSGCGTVATPRNQSVSAWMPQEKATDSAQTCTAAPQPDFTGAQFVSIADFGGRAPTVAPGDRFRIRLPGDDDRISGIYVVNDDGMIVLPSLAPLAVAGLTQQTFLRKLTEALTQADIVRRMNNPVDARLIESAGVPVSIAGAVFDSGTIRVGERSTESRIGQRDGLASGDANPLRTISTALRAAGGVRPDADVSRVYLVRGERWTILDLRGAVAGTSDTDLNLAAGDRVVVPSSGCFHADLVRPTPITAPGIRVYMSNLSRPAVNNASSAIGRDATSLPYGTRMLQGLVAMNCVGGSLMNADRRAVLISRNPMNGKSIVIERDIEHLVRNADRDDEDPYLMPNDALACYDSRAMNFLDIFNVLSSTVAAGSTALLLQNAVHR
jgi:polysaccharide biosynthesis/export protein